MECLQHKGRCCRPWRKCTRRPTGGPLPLLCTSCRHWRVKKHSTARKKATILIVYEGISIITDRERECALISAVYLCKQIPVSCRNQRCRKTTLWPLDRQCQGKCLDRQPWQQTAGDTMEQLPLFQKRLTIVYKWMCFPGFCFFTAFGYISECDLQKDWNETAEYWWFETSLY